jgi:hypothetical protein
LPPDERMAHYTVVRTNLAAAIKELGIEDTIANAWLDKTMHGIQALVWKLRRVVALGRLNCRTTELIFLLLELAVYRVTRRLEPE